MRHLASSIGRAQTLHLGVMILSLVLDVDINKFLKIWILLSEQWKVRYLSF